MMPTIVFLFNTSRYAPDPWLEAGFNCVSVDYNDTDHSDSHELFEHPNHYHLNLDLSGWYAEYLVQRRILALGLAPPSFVISFAPCTDLAVSGAAHFAKKREKDPLFQVKAVRNARLAAYFGVPYMVENPVSVLATQWRKPDFKFHPYQYSGYITSSEAQHPEFPDIIPDYDAYKKLTCIWSGYGARQPMFDVTHEPESEVNPGHAKLGGKSARTKYIRSLTPRGFARAVFERNAAVAFNTHEQILRDAA